MTVRFVPASDVDFSALVRAFNDAYQGYIVPIQLSDDQMRRNIDQNHMDLALSRAGLDDEQIAAVGFVARRETRAWVGGVGVIPQYRGQGLGRALMHTLIESARGAGLATMQLEVITTNTPAHTLYVDLGFKTLRRLLIVECQHVPDPVTPRRVDVVPTQEALAYYDWHAVPNPWQRQREGLLAALKGTTGWLMRDGAAVQAYAVGIIAPGLIYLLDAASAPGQGGALRDLITGIHHMHPEFAFRFVNLGEDDPAWAVLADLGFVETLSQYEMEFPLLS